MAQMNIAFDANAPSLSTFEGVDPSWTGVYFHAIADAAGVVGANNFLSILNPSGSGKLAIALGFTCSSYSVATITLPSSLVAYRISAHSVGTLQSAATINRFLSSFPDPASTVRFGNPTVTTTNGTNPMIGIPPAVGSGASQGQAVAPTPGASFVFKPGEGIVFSTPTGDVDQRWNMQYVWAEKSM